VYLHAPELLAFVLRELQVGPMKTRNPLRLLEREGWVLTRMRGSHRQYKHPDHPGLVTVPGHLAEEVARGTLNSILKQAGIKR